MIEDHAAWSIWGESPEDKRRKAEKLAARKRRKDLVRDVSTASKSLWDLYTNPNYRGFGLFPSERLVNVYLLGRVMRVGNLTEDAVASLMLRVRRNTAQIPAEPPWTSKEIILYLLRGISEGEDVYAMTLVV